MPVPSEFREGGGMETRSFPCEIREEQGQPVLFGYAIRWGDLSEPLTFGRERFVKGAFREWLDSGADVLLLHGHDLSRVLARRSNGTLRAEEDEVGLFVEARPNVDTTHGRDLLALVRRGDVKQLSIGFVAEDERWVDDPEIGTIREVTRAQLREISAVALPAYPTTSVAVRHRDEKGVREMEQRTEQVQPIELATPAAEVRESAFADYLRGRPFDVRQLTVGTDVAGGYLAPEAFVRQLIRGLEEQVVLRQVANVLTVSAARVEIPTLGTGVTAAWTSEAAAIAESEPTFGQVAFTPHKLGALTLVSNELLADAAVNVEQVLAELFAQAFAEQEEHAFLLGNGSGQPSGLLTDAAIPVVTTAAPNAISADEVLRLYDALPPQYRPNAVWIMNPSTMAALRLLKDQSGQYLLVTGLAGPTPTTLLGRPVYLTSRMPAIGAGNKVVVFGDLTRCYTIVQRQGIEVQRSADRYFERDLTAFRAVERVDGKVVLPEAAVILQMASA